MRGIGAAPGNDSNVQRSAPSGLVVFLFTDIEGSTMRWEAHREAMQQALRRHDEILRDAIETHGGHVFKTIGDAFCAAFATMPEALSSAVAAQRRIAGEDWSAVGGLRVRMALHAGETDERSGDYFGPVVNRVARLLATGHGGQVLLSGVAADVAVASLPDGVTLRHLGMLPLKDLKDPERVHQLVVADLPSDFKPLRALETPPNNLPAQPTTFVGRQDDLARVEDLLRHNALVTVVGVGGMGKTRLALQAASDLLNDTREGAWFVDLAPVGEAADVATAILSVLGADQSGDGSPEDRVVAHLKKRALLLVLDNCEHVVESVAGIASAIVAHCPAVTILATSREPLNVSGERLHRLGSLDTPAAVRLFVDRAKAVNPNFACGDATEKRIQEICNRLDGMALAIELAAARVRSISVEELSQRLSLRMLTGGGRERRPRQQTMRALVDWSYDLLSDGDKAVFRSVSVFSGGFDLDAAGAVCAGDAVDTLDVMDRVASLADKSLIVAEVSPSHQRYRLLESIRQYAAERLDESGETQRARQAHALHFASLAERAYEEFDTNPPPDWLARNERELDNYRSALRFTIEEANDPATGARIAGGIGPVFMRLTLLSEGTAWCERATSFAAGLDACVVGRLFYAAGMLYNNQGRFDRALLSAERAVDAYRAIGAPRGLTRALSQLGQQSAKEGLSGRAVSAADESIELARTVGDDNVLAGVLARGATIYDAAGIGYARARFAESVELFRRLGRQSDVARVLGWWAGVEALAGHFETAASIIEEALPIARGDMMTWLTNSAMTIYWSVGDRKQAEPMTREALAQAIRANHAILLPSAITYVAVMAADVDPMQAARLLGYVGVRQKNADWSAEAEPQELDTVQALRFRLREKLGDGELEKLSGEGAAWNDEHAAAVASHF
jgi:predicted ATPase/class 3 adenylate cyclase